jgi:peptidyl-Lys metalloendopeptidase
MFHNSRIYLTLAIGALLLVASAAGTHAGDLLPADLSIRLEPHEGTTIMYTLRNDSPDDIRVLYRQTPLRGVTDDLFEVRIGGQPIAYIGPIFEWGPLEEADFLQIPSGAEVSATVDLAAEYDLKRGGEYTVRARLLHHEDLLTKNCDGDTISPRVSAGDLILRVENADLLPEEQKEKIREIEIEEKINPTGTIRFQGCSATRQAQVVKAMLTARVLAASGEQRLTASTPKSGYADLNYRNAFGCYAPERYQEVKARFSDISHTLSAQNFDFLCFDSEPNCALHPTARAYVIPKQHYIVHLCKPYWSLAANGTYSKAGALVHETSHFFNTIDSAVDTYPSGCQSRARDYPLIAKDYACSYQYFAETKPVAQSGSVAPTIRVGGPGVLYGNGTYFPQFIYFSNPDCDPIVRIENSIVSAPPGNWTTRNVDNPTLFQGTWQGGQFQQWYHCNLNGPGTVGPIVNKHVLVDAANNKSAPAYSYVYCFLP